MILRHIKNGMKGRCDCLSTLIDKFAHILQFINSDGACARRGEPPRAAASGRLRADRPGACADHSSKQYNIIFVRFVSENLCFG